jgi:uncharacterized protein involved in exopolysaccharide biosynthesis
MNDVNDVNDVPVRPPIAGTGLMDFLLAFVENARALVFVPLIMGAFAFGVASFLPQSFTSESILALPIATSTATNTIGLPVITPAQAAAMMVSPVVLDPVVETLGLSDGRPIQVARKRVASQIRAIVGRDGLLRLDATANTPVEAQRLANSIIESWLKSTVPGKEERADLEKRLEAAKFSLDSVDRLLKRLATDGVANLNQPLTRGEAGTSIVGISELQSKFLADVLTIPRILKGVSHDVVKQTPTLPTEPVAPRKVMIATLASLTSGFVVVFWIFLKRVWKVAAQDPLGAVKQQRILSAFRRKNSGEKRQIS